jgi:N-methylhydantoinase A
VGYRLGIDVGGTFTDLLLHDEEQGRTWLAKTPTTPRDQSIGVISGIEQITGQAGIAPSDVTAILHGTTAATNAVLEKRGARVGVVVTAGFRSIFHLAEAWTPGPLFGFMSYEKPEPLVSTDRVVEVPERIGADGTVVRPLDEAAAREAIQELVDQGVEALTICLINAYVNPEHEQAVGRIARELAPDVPVSLSTAVTPEFREYERAVTTAMNAYVAPELERYLTGLRRGLHEIRAGADLQVVRSDGGLMSLDVACETPVTTVLSGPAGGVNGAAFVAGRAGFADILTFDMGGTSTDVAVCRGGVPAISRETRVGEFPVRAPSVEVESIGAGGGSIAWVADVTGALRVGPRSAGADPGPACYGNGATEATVTDANVVLGHLPGRLLGGRMTLDVEAAHAAVGKIAERLGMGVHETAEGIIRLVNENMLGALRVVTVQKGRAPEDFALVSFGGAGGLHANALATMLGCFPVIVPHDPGVLSAMGFVASDVRNEISQTFIRPVDDLDDADVVERLRELAERADAVLQREEVAEVDREITFVVDMRYHRQGFEIPVDVDELDGLSCRELAERFSAAHQRLYGFSLDGGVEVVNVRARARGRVQELSLEPAEPGPADPSAARTGTQKVWSRGTQVEVPIYDRAALRAGMVVPGYAIVEQYDSTTVVLPGHAATVDPWLNLIIRPKEAGQ